MSLQKQLPHVSLDRKAVDNKCLGLDYFDWNLHLQILANTLVEKTVKTQKALTHDWLSHMSH